MSNKNNEINAIMQFAKGRKAERHYLKFLDENGGEMSNMPEHGKEIDVPFDIVVQFVNYGVKQEKRRNK